MTFYLAQVPEKRFFAETASRFPGVSAELLETGVHFRKFAADLERAVDHFLEAHGLMTARFSVLMHLTHSGESGLKATTLADKLGVTRGNMTGLLDGLEAAGLVLRVADAKDRRVAWVKLTKKGQQTLKRVGSEYFKRVCRMLGALDSREHRQLIKMLDRMREKMDFNP